MFYKCSLQMWSASGSFLLQWCLEIIVKPTELNNKHLEPVSSPDCDDSWQLYEEKSTTETAWDLNFFQTVASEEQSIMQPKHVFWVMTQTLFILHCNNIFLVLVCSLYCVHHLHVRPTAESKAFVGPCSWSCSKSAWEISEVKEDETMEKIR